jgi:hypothetical protein
MAKKNIGAAAVDSGHALFGGSSGRWAAEQLLRALKEGRPLSPKALRTLDTLRKDEWKAFDEALVTEGLIRLRGVADLISAGLTIPVSNAMGKTLVEWEKVKDMNAAITSLSGIDRSEDDRLDFELDSIPLPITHKDFNLNLRTLSASRERGEALDTMQASMAGRLVAEQLEYMLFNGGPTFGGKAIYGLLNHPDRNIVDFDSNELWTDAGKDGAGILKDVLTMIKAAENDRFYGPYRLYIPAAYSTPLDEDFKANSDLTIRQRLLQIDRLQAVVTADQLPVNNVALFQASRDVAAVVDGESLQSVQWDVEGGFQIKFKAFAIQVPLIRSTSATKANTTYSVGASATTKKCGVVHLSQL